MITDKVILLVSPLNKIGGKASFTKLIINSYNNNNVRYYHIDLVRAKSSRNEIRYLQHIISFFVYKIKFAWLLINGKIDLVQIHSSSFYDYYDLSIFVIISKIFRRKTIVRYGGASFPEFINSSNVMYKSYIKWVLGLYDVLIVQSNYWENYFLNYGVDKGKIFLLPNFVSDITYYVKSEKYLNDKIHILFMPGKDLKRKGFYDIKEEISEIALNHNNIVFHIVGTDLIKYFNNPKIKLYDEVSGENKIKLFHLCTIFLLPSHAEGFPNSLLEAMSSGMAIITTSIPQISCIVNEDINCLLIPPGSSEQFKEKLLYLINNPQSIYRLGKNARKLVEEKYTEKLIPKYLKELYNG
jgi:glycosyltransferase involved in cell wall biosynthesis